MVLDVTISQEYDDISLALLVGYATSEAKAKSLGDGFVRLSKTFSPDTPPGKAIGEGYTTAWWGLLS